MQAPNARFQKHGLMPDRQRGARLPRCASVQGTPAHTARSSDLAVSVLLGLLEPGAAKLAARDRRLGAHYGCSGSLSAMQ